MVPIHTYELHVLRGQDWIIDQIFESRDEAMREARALVASNPSVAVQLIEERFDPATGTSQETVLFRAQPVDKGSVTFKRRGPAARPATSRRQGTFTLSPVVITVIAVAGAFACGLLIGLARG